ncbi:hypothetical protein K505DRAFT_299398 [Melanomma pulvis-pyrius CBS 109.77]|uniref:Geranylgeranyl pyrophosphate synthetase n=1 Tax=Melanomma pulvis-pyrius CBS 109.77 TaxID=1314802 RepID=A0A6A6XL15_9PLEO|nr:hypothetical protein K505DRAFT_299398 [Melanomma pulvis-pyrius CBS 109.77]
MLKNAGDVVQSINVTSIEAGTIEVSSSAGFELLCTYGWIEQAKHKSGPSIYVPGCPPKWIPATLPIKLEPDKGSQFVDQNAYRLPTYPFEPIFWALDIMNPEIRLYDVDVVCNRNSLRKLLDIASGRRPDPFVMHLHMLQNSLFITRKEKNARTMIRGNGNSGYGHSFEKAFTEAQEGIKDSTGHHRVVRYNMGGLNCVVRFEVDAYYDGLGEGTGAGSFDHTCSLTVAMQQLSLLNTTASHSTNPLKSQKKAIEKGTVLPSSKMAEIKTQGKKSRSLNQYLPQLWFGRTPHLLIGKHPAADGIFKEIINIHAGSKFGEWEEENQDALKKLVGILNKLKEIMSDMEKGAAMLLYEKKGGPLQVLKMKQPTQVLPEESKKYWNSEETGSPVV